MLNNRADYVFTKVPAEVKIDGSLLPLHDSGKTYCTAGSEDIAFLCEAIAERYWLGQTGRGSDVPAAEATNLSQGIIRSVLRYKLSDFVYRCGYESDDWGGWFVDPDTDNSLVFYSSSALESWNGKYPFDALFSAFKRLDSITGFPFQHGDDVFPELKYGLIGRVIRLLYWIHQRATTYLDINSSRTSYEITGDFKLESVHKDTEFPSQDSDETISLPAGQGHIYALTVRRHGESSKAYTDSDEGIVFLEGSGLRQQFPATWAFEHGLVSSVKLWMELEIWYQVYTGDNLTTDVQYAVLFAVPSGWYSIGSAGIVFSTFNTKQIATFVISRLGLSMTPPATANSNAYFCLSVQGYVTKAVFSPATSVPSTWAWTP